MSMVKQEINNIKKLMKVSVNGFPKAIKVFAAWCIAYPLVFTISTIIFTNSYTGEPYIENPMGFTTNITALLYIATVVIVFFYYLYHQNLKIFPTTNMSKLISYNLLFLIVMTSAIFMYVIYYIVSYVAMMIFESINENVIMVLDFDIGYAMCGLLVNLVNVSIIFAFFYIILGIGRKFGVYGIVALCFGVLILIVNLDFSIKVIGSAFIYYYSESDLATFFIRGIAILIILNIIAYAIHYSTKEYKFIKDVKAKMIKLVVVLIVITLSSVLFIDFGFGNIDYNFPETSVKELAVEFDEINIDVSHLEKNSKIDVVLSENIITENADVEESKFKMIFEYGEEIEVLNDTLSLKYKYPTNIEDTIDIMEYVNPKLTAKLIENTLYIDYTYDKDIVLLAVPAFDTYFKFDVFKDKNVYFDQNSYENSIQSVGRIIVEFA